MKRQRTTTGRRRATKPYFYKRRMFLPRTAGAAGVTERKYYDSYLAPTALSSANTWAGSEIDPAATLCLFAPQEGADINNRIGRKVNIVSIKIRGFIQCASQTAQSSCDYGTSCRVILYVDNQTNAAQAQGEDLMADPGAADPFLCGMTFQNTNNFGRFKSLRDKTYVLQNPAVGRSTDGANVVIQNGLVKNFKLSYRFRKPFSVKFNSTNGGTVADIVDNSLHLIARVSNTGMAPSICYQCRVVYTDA